jgi:hypothetical protein
MCAGVALRRRASQSTLVHLAHHDELVAVGADGSVVVEAVAVLRVAADHVVGLSTMRVTELWMPPRCAGDLEPGVFTIFSCAWYIITMPGFTRWLTTARAAMAPLALKLDPVVVHDAGALGVVFAQPHHRPPRFSVSIIRLSL